MKKNDLSVWTFPYRKSYYLTHPWKWFKDIYWNIRNFWHRGRYGYAYSDVWGWYWWWPKVGAEALRYLAEHNWGYPGYEPWETPEKWKAYLKELADKLEWCVETCDIAPDIHDAKNEFKEAYKKYSFADVMSNQLKDDPVYQDTVHKYWKREEELEKEDSEERAKIFSEIGRNLGRFWD